MSRLSFVWLFILAGWLIFPARPAMGQDDELADEGLARGWIATTQSNDVEYQTVEFATLWTVRENEATGPFSARSATAQWSGLLESEARGEYRFAVFLVGQFSLSINDELLLEAESTIGQWHISEAVALRFGLHDVEASLTSREAGGTAKLYWSGPNFEWEPIPLHRMLHDLEDAPDRQWEQGRDLVVSHRCSACHHRANETSLSRSSIDAPELRDLAKHLQPDWLVDRLTESPESTGDQPTRQMPFYGLEEQQAIAIASYLYDRDVDASGTQPDNAPSETSAIRNATSSDEDLQDGQDLLVTVGCLACHTVQGLGHSGAFGGGDLSHVADKRPHGFFEQWLQDPAAINSRHRMPTIKLSSNERKQLALYLQTLRSDDLRSTVELSDEESVIEMGRSLYDTYRCASCHEPESAGETLPIGSALSFDGTCGRMPDRDAARPGFAMNDDELDSVTQFLSIGLSANNESVEQQLHRMNCFQCHQRGEFAGLADTIQGVLERHVDLSPLASSMLPPSLGGIGDKLRPDAIDRTLREGGNQRRPWLSVRMPKYTLSDEQIESIAAWMIESDRMPGGLTEAPRRISEAILPVVGPRLVTSSGFGCTSCHQVGSVQPVNAPLNAMGPDLSMLGDHVNEDWFRRWVSNPSRFEPGMEMPSIQQSVRGVLDEDLDQQLAAVWQILNTPGFEPPKPEPVRIVRHSGESPRSRAHVSTDVTRSQGDVLIKPFVIGLANRHNVLFDFEQARVARWWVGDTLRQQTEGKTWYWELGGPLLWSDQRSDSEWSLKVGDDLWPMRVEQQFPSEVEQWQHRNGAVDFRYSLRFESPDGTATRRLTIDESMVSLRTNNHGETGWRRDIRVSGLEAADTLVLDLSGSATELVSSSNDPQSFSVVNPQPVTIRLLVPDAQIIDESGSVSLSTSSEGVATLAIGYSTQLPIDLVPDTAGTNRELEVENIDVAPGFDAKRLPVDVDWMPTAMSWNQRGELFVTSLKGRVWRVIDSDEDGFEDLALRFSDELAAPFGLHANEDTVDVINKFGLLRLSDNDGDGFAEESRIVASGWGHTEDYHDWAVGLPRDGEGTYYVAFSCQQDDRSRSAAYLRGEVVRLREADDGTFQIERISTGHRFPIGIAMNRDGALFVTDNQGNYNPFNELNHVRQDAWYGFVNRLDQAPPADAEHIGPSVSIPHPWTRSVNGICFLDSPESDSGDGEGFGPFEGHLVGCEYDTQRLVRMSMQRVGETFQGAVYPLTRDSTGEGDVLLGPLACAVSPSGELYIGNIRDSGWGGSNNIGSLVRMTFNRESLPSGIAEIVAVADGFEIRFAKPVDRDLAAEMDRYHISSFRRISTPSYGGDDVDRRNEHPVSVECSSDGLVVKLALDDLREGFVYQFNVDSLVESGEFFPSEAFYSLNVIPDATNSP